MQQEIVEFIRAGVSGFIAKDASVVEFIRTIRSVAAGGSVLPPHYTSTLFSHIAGRALREFGGIEQQKEECRDARGTAFVDNAVRDIFYAFRTFRRAPLAAGPGLVASDGGVGVDPSEPDDVGGAEVQADHLGASTFIEKGWSRISLGDYAGAEASLRKALPDATEEDLYWSYHFLSGALTLSLSQTGRIDRLSNGLCKSSDFESIGRRMAPFVASGFERICKGKVTLL